MLSRLKKFVLLGSGKQLLLAAARYSLLRTGLALFTAGLARHRTIPPTAAISNEQLKQAIVLGHLVAVAARSTPWQSRCLTQVQVLQRLLQQRQIPGYFSLGVRKASGEEEELFNAHAWVQCGDKIFNGAAPWGISTTISTFSWS